MGVSVRYNLRLSDLVARYLTTNYDDVDVGKGNGDSVSHSVTEFYCTTIPYFLAQDPKPYNALDIDISA
jgi:hypothetical protein